MVQVQTYLNIIDNTGVKQVLCIRILNCSKSSAKVGNILIGAVKKVIPKSNIKKSDIVRILLVRTCKGIRRKTGTSLFFTDNAGILITKDFNPLGTRIFGPITRELREYGFSKVITLASEIL